MPATINRSHLMHRAWHLFRAEFGGPGCILRNHPREAMRAAMRAAWREAKAAVVIAAMPEHERCARIARLREALANLAFVDSTRAAAQQAAELGAQLRALQAAGKRSAYVARREGDAFVLRRNGTTFARLVPAGPCFRLDAPAALAAEVHLTTGEPLATALAKIRAADEAMRVCA